VPMSLFRYNPEIHDNPEFQWPREGSGSAPPSPLAALLAARDRAYSPLLSQLLQTNPTGMARGINQAQVPTGSFDSTDQPSVTPAQHLGPFIEAIKPGFEFGMETLGARKPTLPPMPEGLAKPDPALAETLGWGNAMKAKPWAEQIMKDPVFADQVIQKLQKMGISKDTIQQWGKWYGERFQENPNAEQFSWRSQGLKHLHDRFPSMSPASTLSICPAGWVCT
jgi:hypothetical protein